MNPTPEQAKGAMEKVGAIVNPFMESVPKDILNKYLPEGQVGILKLLNDALGGKLGPALKARSSHVFVEIGKLTLSFNLGLIEQEQRRQAAARPLAPQPPRRHA